MLKQKDLFHQVIVSEHPWVLAINVRFKFKHTHRGITASLLRSLKFLQERSCYSAISGKQIKVLLNELIQPQQV
jgi:hypothetical protein